MDAYHAYEYAIREDGSRSGAKDFGEWLLETSETDGEGYKHVEGVHTPSCGKDGIE